MPNRYSRFIFLLLILIAVPVFCATVKKAAVKPAQSTKLNLQSKGVTLNWVEKGKVRMSAKAVEFKGDEISGRGQLVKFTAKLYENGILKAVISADKAIADTKKRVIFAEGNIVMNSSIRETSVRASKIKWFAKEQRIIGLKANIKSTMGNMQAPAFEADTGLKSITLKNSVTGF